MLSSAIAIASQYVAWYFWCCVVWIIVGLAVGVIGYRVKSGELALALMVIGAAIIVANVQDAIKAYVAPQVLVAEKIKELVK